MHAPADETPDFDLLAELLVIHDRNGRCRERDLLAALPHLRAEDAHAALDRLVASGQAESVAGGLAPTSFGRELVERAHARGSTGARLLVGALFPTIEAARAGREPLADPVVIELKMERNVGTIDCSIDEARSRGWLKAPARQGKILREARGEVLKSLNVLEFMAGEAMRLTGETVPSELPNTFVYTVRRPISVVGAITPLPISMMKTVLDYIEIGKREGARLACGGGRAGGKGYFVQPTVFTGVRPDMRIAQEEIFGPVLSILRVKDFDEGLRVCNGVRYGLTSSIYTNDQAVAFRFIDGIETGITHVNSPTMGGEAQLPFGGMKATGVGAREMGRAAVEFFSETKTVYVDYTGRKRTSNIY